MCRVNANHKVFTREKGGEKKSEAIDWKGIYH